jgi:hypothetical protein
MSVLNTMKLNIVQLLHCFIPSFLSVILREICILDSFLVLQSYFTNL